jgi:hypothetical protein
VDTDISKENSAGIFRVLALFYEQVTREKDREDNPIRDSKKIFPIVPNQAYFFLFVCVFMEYVFEYVEMLICFCFIYIFIQTFL